jgi:hypothetical protein
MSLEKIMCKFKVLHKLDVAKFLKRYVPKPCLGHGSRVYSNGTFIFYLYVKESFLECGR